VYLTVVCLLGVYLPGVHLMEIHFMGVHLIGVHLMHVSHKACISWHRRASRMCLIGEYLISVRIMT
jgi:hypothetical protein